MGVALLAGTNADISELVNADPHQRIDGLKFIKHGFSYKFGDDVRTGGVAARSGAGNAGANHHHEHNGDDHSGYQDHSKYEDHSATGYGRDAPDNDVRTFIHWMK